MPQWLGRWLGWETMSTLSADLPTSLRASRSRERSCRRPAGRGGQQRRVSQGEVGRRSSTTGRCDRQAVPPHCKSWTTVPRRHGIRLRRGRHRGPHCGADRSVPWAWFARRRSYRPRPLVAARGDPVGHSDGEVGRTRHRGQQGHWSELVSQVQRPRLSPRHRPVRSPKRRQRRRAARNADRPTWKDLACGRPRERVSRSSLGLRCVVKVGCGARQLRNQSGSILLPPRVPAANSPIESSSNGSCRRDCR